MAANGGHIGLNLPGMTSRGKGSIHSGAYAGGVRTNPPFGSELFFVLYYITALP